MMMMDVHVVVVLRAANFFLDSDHFSVEKIEGLGAEDDIFF